MIESSLLLPAFIAGILTFFAPCTMPLIPGFIAYISGVTASNGTVEKPHTLSTITTTLFHSILFLLGFSIVFVGLGSLVRLGLTTLDQNTLRITSSMVIITFGILLFLQYVKVLPLAFFRTVQINLNNVNLNNHPIGSILLGIVFAFGWSPCIGPILASILLLSTQTASLVSGIILLIMFSLGFSLPFISLSLLLHFGVTSIQKRISRYLPFVTLLSAVLLITIGILTFTNTYDVVAGHIYRTVMNPDIYSWLIDRM